MKCTKKNCYVDMGIGCEMGEPDPCDCKYAVKDVIQFIKDQGIETAKLTLEVVPVQEIEIPDNKSGATYSFSRDSLKRMVKSVDEINGFGGIGMAKLINQSVDGDYLDLEQSITDWESIYG
ncbi:hypothetical protein QSV37_15130 [Acinetobacter sp. VNK23]|uniref:hypothetical protein n=1 Tax=Acinetobacter thutiue TaxID=2998078 RepID=UPI00257848E4|nr:hypothetical protein [Acinetobacter thutiue]MDM1021625.1 hypothetical protein [Acinetobacter thutiue]